MSPNTEEWCKIWRKTDFLLQKWKEFVEFYIQALKSLNIFTFTCPFCTKYTTFDLKRNRGIIFHDAKVSCKISMYNVIGNLANFCQSIWQCENWDFDGILLSKVDHLWLKDYREVMCNETEEWLKIWQGIELSFQN